WRLTRRRHLPAAATDDEWIVARPGKRDSANRNDRHLDEGAGEARGVVEHRLDRGHEARERVSVDDGCPGRAVVAVERDLRQPEGGRRHDRADRKAGCGDDCEKGAPHVIPPDSYAHVRHAGPRWFTDLPTELLSARCTPRSMHTSSRRYMSELKRADLQVKGLARGDRLGRVRHRVLGESRGERDGRRRDVRRDRVGEPERDEGESAEDPGARREAAPVTAAAGREEREEREEHEADRHDDRELLHALAADGERHLR